MTTERERKEQERFNRQLLKALEIPEVQELLREIAEKARAEGGSP
jgi:hypothetical protein